MEEVVHVPAWPIFTGRRNFFPLLAVVFPQELLANQSKDEDNDGQDDGQVPQGPDRVADDFDERV